VIVSFVQTCCRWCPIANTLASCVPIPITFRSAIRQRSAVRWHRADFRRYWRWKSLGRGGRPQIETELRALIPRLSIENPL